MNAYTLLEGPLSVLSLFDGSSVARLLGVYQDRPWFLLLFLIPTLMLLFRKSTLAPVVLTHHPHPAMIEVNEGVSGQTIKESFVEYIRRKCPSLAEPHGQAIFHPTLWLANGHLQTFYTSTNAFEKMYKVIYDRELLKTPDGGTISIDWAPPLSVMPADNTPTLVLLHGLTGGSFESYIRDLVYTMTHVHGYRCVVFNARACADTALTSPQLFSGGYTDDLRLVVKHIRTILPSAKLMGAGFSMGSNVLMNYMGEEGDQCEFLGAVSVSNPFDMLGTCLAIERGFVGKHVYRYVMGGNLKNLFLKNIQVFFNSTIIDVSEVQRDVHTMRQFDDQVTRKVFGFTTVSEYYRAASCAPRLLSIRRPFLCLSALDDPIAVQECLPRDEIRANPFGLLATTAQGGHLGWFEGFWRPKRWCTRPLAEFCTAMFEIKQ
ncbi:hypothetical protein BGX28_007904 [Mortierella sp. GBA30]|nr:hypothetical protein BGX28_007904 [Mortierella sp. GBA30]